MWAWDKVRKKKRGRERERAREDLRRLSVSVCVSQSPILSCSLSSEDIPHTVTLLCYSWHSPLIVLSPHIRSSLLNLPLSSLSYSLPPNLTKGRRHLLRSPFLPSPFILLPLPLHRLSIKPTKGERRSAQKGSPLFSLSSSMAAPFLSPLSPVFHPPLLSSLPFSHLLCVFPLS